MLLRQYCKQRCPKCKDDVLNQERELRTPPYLSDLGLVFFCLGADLAVAANSLGCASADSPPLDCSSILCLSYSRRTTSDREGGGWNVTGAFIGVGSSFESALLFLRPVDVEFFLSKFKRRRFHIFTISQYAFSVLPLAFLKRVLVPNFHMKMRFHSHAIRSDEGLTLETSASKSLYGGQFTLSTQLIKPNYLVILPPTQHHSFFRNLPPLFILI